MSVLELELYTLNIQNKLAAVNSLLAMARFSQQHVITAITVF